MALDIHAGAETGDLSEATSTAGTVSASQIQVNTGSYAYRINPTVNTTNYIRCRAVAGTRLTAYVYIATAPDVDALILGNIGSENILLNTDLKLELRTGGTTRDTGDTVLNTSQWYRISLSVDGDNGKAYINGIEECSAAHVDFDQVVPDIACTGTNVTADIYFDDIASDSTSSTDDIDNIRVQVALPIANGNQNDYDQTSGFGFCNNLPDDTDYVEDNDSDVARELFGLTTMTTMGVSGATPQAINIEYRMDRDGGGGTNHGITARDNGTNNETLNAGTAAWTQYSKYYPTLPTGGGAWTEARFDALEVGPYHFGAQDQRCSTVNVMLAYIPAGGADVTETINDSLGITDARTLVREVLRTIAESLGVTDARTKVSTFARTIAESLGVTDARSTALGITFAESLGLTDAATELKSIEITFNESMGVTDQETKVASAIRQIAESMGIVDLLAKDETKLVSDSLGITDQQSTALGISFVESLGITDTFSKDELKVISESLGITDVVSRVCLVLRTLSESLGITDDVPRVWLALRTFSESLGVTDSVTELIELLKTIGDNIGVTDTVSKDELKVIAESLGITDEVSRLWLALRTFSESLGLTDSVSELFAHLRAINDGVGLTDSFSRVYIALRVLSEDLGLADAVTRVLGIARLISDSEGITDGVALQRLVTVTDALGVTDDALRVIDYLRTQEESIGLLDSIVRVSLISRTISDDMGISDEMSKQLEGLSKAAWAFVVMRQTHN